MEQTLVCSEGLRSVYYRDPCAKDKGIMDGVIDLNTVTAVMPLQVHTKLRIPDCRE